jgi:hypothetical protein
MQGDLGPDALKVVVHRRERFPEIASLSGIRYRNGDEVRVLGVVHVESLCCTRFLVSK